MLGDPSGTQFGHMDVYLKFLEGRMLILRRSKVPFVRPRGPPSRLHTERNLAHLVMPWRPKGKFVRSPGRYCKNVQKQVVFDGI